MSMLLGGGRDQATHPWGGPYLVQQQAVAG
jgi:hypothetical protein